MLGQALQAGRARALGPSRPPLGSWGKPGPCPQVSEDLGSVSQRPRLHPAITECRGRGCHRGLHHEAGPLSLFPGVCWAQGRGRSPRAHGAVSPQVSTHGYSQNQILVWKYPSLTQVAKLTGHSYRVLYLVSPPGPGQGVSHSSAGAWTQPPGGWCPRASSGGIALGLLGRTLPPPCGEGRLCLLESLPGCLFSHACVHAHSRCQKCPVPTAAVVSGRFRVVCTRLEKEPVSRPCSFFHFLCHTRKKCSVLHLAYPLPSVTEQAVPPGDRVVASSVFSEERSTPGLVGQPRACLPFPSWQPRLAVALGPDSLPLAPAILCRRGHLQGTRTMASVPLQAMSPDGEAIVTGAGDETLRFWNVFSKTRSTKVKWVGISASCPPARPLGLSPGRPPPPLAPLISPRGSSWVPCPSAPAWLCTPSHIAWGPQGLVAPHLGRWEAAHPSPLARSLGFPLG